MASFCLACSGNVDPDDTGQPSEPDTPAVPGGNDTETVVTSRFARNVCVMEFTGVWCAQCPGGAEVLNYLVGRQYKDEAYALAFHNEDIYALPQEQELKKIFNWTGYPAYVTDMRDCGLLTEGTGCSMSIDRSLYDTETHCGAAVACAFDASSSMVTVTAKAFSEKTMTYRMAAYVVGDKVVGSQLLSTGTYQDDYTHRHVVRRMLSSDVRGDSLGELAPEAEAVKTYTFAVDPEWNIDNLSVAVLVLDSGTRVNNMAVCSALDGSMDYEYINEQ